MTARSATLAVGQLTDTNVHTCLVCPANTTLLVKSATYYSRAAAAVSFSLWIRRGTLAAFLFNSTNVAPQTPQFWQGWLVMEPGDDMRVNATGTTVEFFVFGTVLEGVAPPTEQPLAGTLPRP